MNAVSLRLRSTINSAMPPATNNVPNPTRTQIFEPVTGKDPVGTAAVGLDVLDAVTEVDGESDALGLTEVDGDALVLALTEADADTEVEAEGQAVGGAHVGGFLYNSTFCVGDAEADLQGFGYPPVANDGLAIIIAPKVTAANAASAFFMLLPKVVWFRRACPEDDSNVLSWGESEAKAQPCIDQPGPIKLTTCS